MWNGGLWTTDLAAEMRHATNDGAREFKRLGALQWTGDWSDSDGSGEDGDEWQPCVVCQRNLRRHGEVRTLKCGHSFHQRCGDEWLYKKKSCPVCRDRTDRREAQSAATHQHRSAIVRLTPLPARPLPGRDGARQSARAAALND